MARVFVGGPAERSGKYIQPTAMQVFIHVYKPFKKPKARQLNEIY